MKRASTPTCLFFFPSDPREYDEILITFSQNNDTIIEKRKSRNEIELGYNFRRELYSGHFRLTQEETNLFDSRYKLSIQIRIFSQEMGCYPSSIYIVDVEDVLNDEVIDI